MYSKKIPTYISVYNGICHFLREKKLFSTVHPIWIVFIYYLSGLITDNYIERVLLTLFQLYSMLFEMINSSIEQTNDRIGMEFNIHTKRAKEMSGAVTALSRIPILLIIFHILKNK